MEPGDELNLDGDDEYARRFAESVVIDVLDVSVDVDTARIALAASRQSANRLLWSRLLCYMLHAPVTAVAGVLGSVHIAAGVSCTAVKRRS